MKKIAMAAFLCAYTVVGYAQHQHNPDKASVTQLFRTMEWYERKGETDSVMQLYVNSPETRYIHDGNLINGWNEIMILKKKQALRNISYQVQSIEFTGRGAAFVVVLQTRSQKKAKERSYATYIINKSSGEWLISVEHE
jgi:hypothetical protein